MADIWITRFEEALTKLDDEKEEISDRAKKIFFLNNIIDEKYNVVKTILKGNDFDYKKYVLEIRKESIGIKNPEDAMRGRV